MAFAPSREANALGKELDLKCPPSPSYSDLPSVHDAAVRRIIDVVKLAAAQRCGDEYVEFEVRDCLEDVLEAYQRQTQAKHNQQLVSQRSRSRRREALQKQRAVLQRQVLDRENVLVLEHVDIAGLTRVSEGSKKLLEVEKSSHPSQENLRAVIQRSVSADHNLKERSVIHRSMSQEQKERPAVQRVHVATEIIVEEQEVLWDPSLLTALVDSQQLVAGACRAACRRFDVQSDEVLDLGKVQVLVAQVGSRLGVPILPEEKTAYFFQRYSMVEGLHMHVGEFVEFYRALLHHMIHKHQTQNWSLSAKPVPRVREYNEFSRSLLQQMLCSQ